MLQVKQIKAGYIVVDSEVGQLGAVMDTAEEARAMMEVMFDPGIERTPHCPPADEIIRRMGRAMADAEAERGHCDIADLLDQGFVTAQIDRHGDAARAHAATLRQLRSTRAA